MSYQKPLRSHHRLLQIRWHQPRGARGDHDVRRRYLADVTKHSLFQLELLRNVLLDEIGLARHRQQIRRETELSLGWKRRDRQARECGLGVLNGAAYPAPHLRLDVRGDHVDTEVQRTCGPPAPDDAGTQKTQSLDLSHSGFAFIMLSS